MKKLNNFKKKIMKPIINNTKFGSIEIEREVYEHDVVIRLNGEIKKKICEYDFGVY